MAEEGLRDLVMYETHGVRYNACFASTLSSWCCEQGTVLMAVFSPEIYIQMCTMNNQTLNGFVYTLLLNVKLETLSAAAVGREIIN